MLDLPGPDAPETSQPDPSCAALERVACRDPPAKKPARKRPPAKKKPKAADSAEGSLSGSDVSTSDSDASAEPAPVKKSRSRSRKPKTAAVGDASTDPGDFSAGSSDSSAELRDASAAAAAAPAPAVATLLFKAPDPTEAAPVRRTRQPRVRRDPEEVVDAEEVKAPAAEAANPSDDDNDDDSDGPDGTGRRRRRRGGRRRRKSGDGTDSEGSEAETDTAEDTDGEETAGDGTSRRRRRRRRAGEDGGENGDDPQNTVTRVRTRRTSEDEITAVAGSTRLEAKKQRRREGREAGRRRAPIVSEAEFLARRESVDRVMVVRQRGELTQIAVLEDKVLVEHYVARESQTSLIGNVYIGRVQNVLPSMEAAFVDIGKGRNAVLYAGEVNWSGLGHKDGQPRKIESFLTSGQSILVQVTKDPVGHKGARLTSQVSLAGRFLVYVPDGTTSGISRKLPDTERYRLKALLKDIVPDTAGVIVRTAAEGATEDELTRDVERLKARWEDIEAKSKGNAPALLYGEPDLTLKVVRDLFTEDFTKLIIEGDDAWDTVQGYVAHVAPDLEPRLERFTPSNSADVFTAYRIDEQIAKGLDRKVWLPSGGSLVIDRTEAMTVVDVNTGKFTGSGGNLEETVTRNNLEAADEMVRQLRLRDIGGIIVIDFIDMVLESNRDLVLRRLAECLGRDRTRHQVAEVTSLGLVQMTRKRIGTGLLEAFSENCEHCQGRGVVVQDAPVPPRNADEDRRPARRPRGRGRGGADDNGNGNGNGQASARPVTPSPRDVAAVARPDNEVVVDLDEPESSVSLDDVREVPTLDAEPLEDFPLADEPAGVESDAATVLEGTGLEVPKPEVAEPEVAEPEVAEPDVEAEPAAPAVVVRTRRRAASRPAGPPAEAPKLEAPTEASPESVADANEHEAPHIEHVPIKRKGSRKR